MLVIKMIIVKRCKITIRLQLKGNILKSPTVYLHNSIVIIKALFTTKSSVSLHHDTAYFYIRIIVKKFLSQYTYDVS